MIYYVRHGQSTDNVYDIATGRNDVLLTEKGVQQAKDAGEALKDVKFEICYCSPLTRTKQTMKEILKFQKEEVPIVIEPRIIERDYGDFTGLRPHEINQEDYKNRYKFDYKMKSKGVESVEAICERAKGFYDDIIKKHSGKNVLVIAHGGFGRATLAYFNGIPEDRDLTSLLMGNAKIMQYEN